MKSKTYNEKFLEQVRTLNKKITDSFISDRIEHDVTVHLLDCVLCCDSTIQLHQVQIALRKFEKE